MAAAGAWLMAFEEVRTHRNFEQLNGLLEVGNDPVDPNVVLEWDGAFLTPLFVATLLRLDDHLPKLLSVGANPSAQCLYQDLLCRPLHAAALGRDCATLLVLLDAVTCEDDWIAETSALDDDGDAEGFVDLNVLHAMVVKDVFADEVYRMLMNRGMKLSKPCRTRRGELVQGLVLPSKLGNKEATEQMLDTVIGEELMYAIRCCRVADELNELLESGSTVKRQQGKTAYRFVQDIDFDLTSGANAECTTTALLYAAQHGTSAAVRLLLYAGADIQRRMPVKVRYDETRNITLLAQALHLAALRGDTQMLEDLAFFGVDVASECTGEVVNPAEDAPNDQWMRLTCLHVTVLNSSPKVIAPLLKIDCDINAVAAHQGHEGSREDVTPLMLAALVGDVLCASELLDRGARVDFRTREIAYKSNVLGEMFGGPPAVGIEDWLSALLTSEQALQRLIDRRTDLSRPLSWPRGPGACKALLESHRLAGPEMIERLEKAFGEVPTELREVRPVHLACLLQQSWALEMLVKAGAPVAEAPPCIEVPHDDAMPPVGVLSPELARGVPLDAVMLCSRVGGLHMLELLSSSCQCNLDVRRELPTIIDITPAFYPRPSVSGQGEDLEPTWAWSRMSALELALLHKRADAAVLLVRLGADLLHTVDHVALRPPSHYSITDACFRNLTPLHICALLNYPVAAAALLTEAAPDLGEVVPGEHSRPQRQELLTAVCVQAWATVDTEGDPEREPWLWRDLTPLHLAIISGNYDLADILVDASKPQTLDALCFSRDVSGDNERSFSALLLAYERNHKSLHRKIAKKFPAC